MPRMPLLLYRYIIGDLIRVVLLTTAVLVSVIAFGAAIRPLAADQILGPLQVAKYIVLAIVPMLQFALPFAAGFAATMSFHRMTGDNEIMAFAVGGISYLRTLQPVVVLGVVLLSIMVGLTQWVIPSFWVLMEQTITRDVTDIFQSRIKSGHPFTVGNTQIHADEIIPQANPPDTGAESRLILLGVAAAELDDDGRVVTDITASRAAIDIYRRHGQTYLKLILTDTVVFKSMTGELIHMPRVEPKAVMIPSGLRSEARAMTRGQLLALRSDPEGYGTIHNFKLELANALYDYEIWEDLSDQLRRTGSLTLDNVSLTFRSYHILADRIENGVFLRDSSEAVVITENENDRPVRRFIGSKVELVRTLSDSISQAIFEVRLTDVQVVDLENEQAVNYRQGFSLNMGSPGKLQTEDLSDRPVAEVLEKSRPYVHEDPAIGRIVRKLDRRLEQLQWEVTSRLLNRYALSVTALLLPVLGSILAIWLKQNQPLTIYMLAFMPAILDLILISGGGQMMSDGRLIAGGLVMWSGNSVLLLIALVAFLRLRRN